MKDLNGHSPRKVRKRDKFQVTRRRLQVQVSVIGVLRYARDEPATWNLQPECVQGESYLARTFYFTYIVVTLTIAFMHEEPYGEYSFLLDRTARRVKQFAQQRFKTLKFPVTVDQWLVMKNLYEKGGMKQNELAEILFKDNPTLTRIIDLLADKSLVVRNPHPTDRRSFQLELTKEGKKKVEQLRPKIQDIRLQAWDGLSEKDFQHFKKVLNTIYKNLE